MGVRGDEISMLAMRRRAPLMSKGVTCSPVPMPRFCAAGFRPGLFLALLCRA